MTDLARAELTTRLVGSFPGSFVSRQGGPCAVLTARRRPVPFPGGFHTQLHLGFVISVVVILVGAEGITRAIRHTDCKFITGAFLRMPCGISTPTRKRPFLEAPRAPPLPRDPPARSPTALTPSTMRFACSGSPWR